MKSIPFASPPVSFIPRDAEGHTIDVIGSCAAQAYITSVLVYAAMSYRARKLAEAPLMVVQQDDDGDEWLPEHELAGLLQYPNADEEMADLLEATCVALDSTGMALWVKDSDRAGRPARLMLFGGDEFTVRTANGRVYGAFDVSTAPDPIRAPTGKRAFGPDDVVFFRYHHPTDRWRGLAPVDVVSRDIGIEARLLRSMLHGIDNSVVPGISVTYPVEANLTPTQVEELKGFISANYQAARNHGKAFVLGGGATATQHRLGFAGLAGGDLYREIESRVCATFGVPPVVLGVAIGIENSPWSQMEEARRAVYEETIAPLWRKIERACTRQLLRPLDDDVTHLVRFDTSEISALQDDREQLAKVQLLLRGIATRNQRRMIAGEEPMDGEMNGDPDFWDSVETSGGALPNDPEDPTDASATVRLSQPAKAQAKAITARELRHKLWDAEVRGQEIGWLIAASHQLERDREKILDMARLYLRPAKSLDLKGPPPPFGADPESIRRLIEALAKNLDMSNAWLARVTPLIKGTAQRAIEGAAAQVGISFGLLQPGLQKYVQRHAADLVGHVTSTTKQTIRDALQAGLEKGEGIPELINRIRESGAFSTSRAQMIARTETTGISNGSARSALKDWSAANNTSVFKQWLSSQDNRTRDSHAALDGEEVEIDGTFSNGLTAPGVGGDASEVVNCRCTMIYRVAEAKAAPPPRLIRKKITMIDHKGEPRTAVVVETEE